MFNEIDIGDNIEVVEVSFQQGLRRRVIVDISDQSHLIKKYPKVPTEHFGLLYLRMLYSGYSHQRPDAN